MTTLLSAVHSRRLHLMTLIVVIPSCLTGTEGDNPFSGPVNPSPCKGKEDYSAFAASFKRPPAASLAKAAPKHDRYATLEHLLIARDEMPVTLECLEWEYVSGELSLMVSNFSGPCGAKWEGATRLVETGALTIQLDTCLVAGCGSCTYDTSAQLAAPLEGIVGPAGDTLEVTLALGDCEGHATSERRWSVPLLEQPAGIVCQPAVPPFSPIMSDHFSETQRNLYAVCEPPMAHVECTEGRSCVDGYCMAPCTETADCPMAGVLVCDDAACRLPQ